MDRSRQPLDPAQLSWTHANRTLVVSVRSFSRRDHAGISSSVCVFGVSSMFVQYEKPPFIVTAEQEWKRERAKMRPQKDGDCKQQ